jgi:N-acetylglucosaminyldiphosphoundecaprenol N-acetyl-beta-D-mannosaminyltransferase
VASPAARWGGPDLPWVRNCGVRVLAVDPDEAVRLVLAASSRAGVDPAVRPGVGAHLCNAWTLACARADPGYAAVLERGDLPFPDGTPLVWFARLAGAGTSRRVYGPDLVLGVVDDGRRVGARHYLLGGTPDALASFRAALAARSPGVEIVGAESPPFRPLDDDDVSAMAERIVDAGATIVWIGLGTPQQDLLVDRLRPLVPSVLVPVGAAFDFIGGIKRQAPPWVQRAGLEWAFRLVTEPGRLWRRYLIGIPSYLWGTLGDLIRGGGRPPLRND